MIGPIFVSMLHPERFHCPDRSYCFRPFVRNINDPPRGAEVFLQINNLGFLVFFELFPQLGNQLHLSAAKAVN